MSTEALLRSPASTLGDAEFALFRDLIHRETGIALNESKRALLVARLGRRLRELGLASFAAYHRYLVRSDEDGSERQRLVNAITTNKTEFFREAHQWEFLASDVFPEWRRRASRKLRIWSAGCSTGEEPYSIAAALAQAFPDLESWDARILASDIDTDVLETAGEAIYDASAVATLDPELRDRCFERGTGEREGLVRVRAELRRRVELRPINLVGDEWPVRGKLDAIFCRNVSIYFDQPTQRRLFDRLAEHLAPGGYLLVGHSECLHWLVDRFDVLRNGIYRLREQPASPGRAPAPAARPVEVDTISIGGLSASRAPRVVKTVLGSCVSACLYDAKTRIGGMNHFLLPEGSEDADVATRYGVHAMEVLVNELMKLGADRRRLVAKVFGASVLLGNEVGEKVAKRNAEFVKRFLTTEDIPIAGELLGGDEPMEVLFETHTGRARVRRIRSSDLGSLEQEEQRFLRARPARAAEPELF